MDLRAFAMHMMAAASPEEPAADQPLSPVQLSPDARRQAAALLATRVPRVRVTNAYWRKPRRSAARRRADLDEQSGGYDAWEYPPDAQQDTHQERIEKADANWRRTLPQRQSQRLASAQRHDAIRAAAKQAVLASVQADIDNVVHTDACCHIGQHFSQQQGHQGRLLQQGGTQEQEQLQQQNSEGPAPAAATAVRSQDKAVRYVGLAVTDGEVQLRSFGCMCCDVWSVMPEAVACAPATPMQPQTIFADQLLWFFHHLTIGDSAVSATAFCAALSKMSDRPVDDRSFLPAYQQWRHVVRPLEDPDELAAHLQKISAQPGSSIAFLALQLPGSGPFMLSQSNHACISNGLGPSLTLFTFSC